MSDSAKTIGFIVAHLRPWAIPLLLPAAVLFALACAMCWIGLKVADLIGGVK